VVLRAPKNIFGTHLVLRKQKPNISCKILSGTKNIRH
jgi:hypothetical protein